MTILNKKSTILLAGLSIIAMSGCTSNQANQINQEISKINKANNLSYAVVILTKQNITGLIWMRGPNTDLSTPQKEDKMSFDAAKEYVKK